MLALKAERSGSNTLSKKNYDPSQYSEQCGDSVSVKDYVNKIKLLEYDYNALHNKRLQDVS